MDNVLRKIRKQNRASITDLSQRTGLPLSYILKIENGTLIPPKEHYELLIDASGWSWGADDVAGLILRDLSE